MPEIYWTVTERKHALHQESNIQEKNDDNQEKKRKGMENANSNQTFNLIS